MTQSASPSISTVDYRAGQQSHHQKILAQLLEHQLGSSAPAPAQPAMFVDTTSNTLGLGLDLDLMASDLYSSASNGSFSALGADEHRRSASSSISSGTSHTYLKSPLVDKSSNYTSPIVRDNLGWGDMTFGMVAQAQANLAMGMSDANEAYRTAAKNISAAWLPPSGPPQSIDPGYLSQASAPNTISIDQYPQSMAMFAPVPVPWSATLPPQTFAPSPLRSMSPGSDDDESEGDSAADEEEEDVQRPGDDMSDPTSDGATRRSSRLRKRSDSDFILESPGGVKDKTRRLTWSSANDARQREFEVEVSEREAERLREMEKFEQSNGKGNRKERRRLQNRLAQRAFRARAKIQGKEFNEHMGDLESKTIDQADRISQLTQVVDRLQKENAALKAERWAAINGVRVP